ncbi:MAG: glycosyltransferase [Phycisphaeraceae bacterium]|nr:glycosyltransferase [Phycisphaeraceae bacterium]
MPPIIPPDIAQPDRHGGVHRPSWTGADRFGGHYLSEEHRGIFEATSGLPGWQDPPDSHKIYETAYFNGSVILEIGVYGGRSAVVAMRGALAGARDRGLAPPQFYGIDIDGAAMGRGAETIRREGLAEHALLFHGDLARFLAEVPITPSMVFVDGDHAYPGCWNDLRLLASRLAPGTPVVCHDYGWLAGVREAVDEAIRAGAYEKMGQFCTSVLLRATDVRVPGRPSVARGLKPATFGALRDALFKRYFRASPPRLRADRAFTPTRDLTVAARAELLGLPAPERVGDDWPHVCGRTGGGLARSLPKLSIITPTLNAGSYLEDTIRSVAMQGYPNLEHIIVDRGSTDDTLDIARRYREHVSAVFADASQGVTGRMRRALGAASGERLVWLEGGEVLPPNALQTIGEAVASASAALPSARDRACGLRQPIEKFLTPGDAWLGGRVFHIDDLAGRRTPLAPHEVHQVAYHHGQVILAVGTLGGRAGLVELRGALAGARDRVLPAPQLFAVDASAEALGAMRDAMDRAGLSNHAALYLGELRAFLRELPITPTLVLLDGLYGYDECRDVLRELRGVLAPGTPLIARQYFRSKAVHRAIDEALSEGHFGRIGLIGGMLMTSGGPESAGSAPLFRGRGLSAATFEATRGALLGELSGRPPLEGRGLVTGEARRELVGEHHDHIASGRGRWPYAAARAALPPTMPSGKPWPKISIVTPSYNQGRYIEETILSVRHQGYPNVEHIIMDGGSTDDTPDIIDRYRDGFAHAVSQKDRGQSDAINRGFKLATGEILTWLNSDDMLAEGALAAIAMAFETSGADMVVGECHVHREGKVESRHLTACDHGPLPLEDLFDLDGCWLEGQFFYQPEVMFSRRIWERAGAHVREDLYHSMDYDLWLRMARAGARMHVIGRPVALFRAHEEQKTAGNVVGGYRVELPKARDAFIEREGLSWSGQTQPRRRGGLRVVLFNDLGFAYGAGIAHRRMAEAFLNAGHDVFAVAASLTDYHSSAPRATHEDTVRKIAGFNPDLVVIGNLHGAALEPSLLGAIAARFRTAFIMHDQWLLTGRCAYSGACEKYKVRCDGGCTCPQVHPMMEGPLVGPAWESKRRVLGGSPSLATWTNSDWLNTRATEALSGAGRLAGPGPLPIKFGFELDTFRPRDKSACRDALGLPQDAFIIMSSASSVSDPRKGLSHLADALAMLRLRDAQVVCVGWFGDREEPPVPGMRAMGYMKDPRQLATLYAAADVFVGPSLEEAFGQVFIEAAACGTPSVAYPVGGIPEALKHGVSGLLAASVDPRSLAAAIGELYQDRALRENLGRWGRLWVENEWSMSASYHRLFQVMRRSGWLEELGLGRRLHLSVRPRPVPDVSVIGPTMPGWRAVSGLDYWEGPYPDRGIGRCRWALGPSAVVEVEADSPDQATLVVSCRNFHHGQRVRVVHEGTVVGEQALRADDGGTQDQVLSFPVSLRRGGNRIEMHFWKWSTGQGERPMAILITGITVIPRSSVALTIETKPVAPAPA